VSGCEYRTDATAILDADARERLIGGGRLQLVTLQLHNTGYHVDAAGNELAPQPVVRCELRADDARALAACLLACAEQAEPHPQA
jgi:hypothetical protein